MIVTFTPNPALDITYNVPTLQLGESHRVADPLTRPGGKGLNVTRILAAHNCPVNAIVPLGGATGKQVQNGLESLNVPFTAVQVAGETRRTLALVSATETTNFNETGTPYSEAEWNLLQAQVAQAIANAKVFVFSGSLPPQTPAGTVAAYLKIAQQNGVKTLVDVSGAALLEAAAAGANLLKPNQSELAAATGVDCPLQGAQKLLDLGTKLVLVSLGANGILAVRKNNVRHAKLAYVLQGNTTGAGDAAVAACAKNFLELAESELTSTTLDDLLHEAVAWSAAAVQAAVAGEIHVTRELIDAVQIGDYQQAAGGSNDTGSN